MSAEFLREAAALMRSRVAAVRAAAEEPNSWFGADEIAASFDFSGIGEMGDARSDAEHIASWHPDVALAVAQLLENEASLITSTETNPGLYSPLNGARVGLLVEIARTYLGRDA